MSQAISNLLIDKGVDYYDIKREGNVDFNCKSIKTPESWALELHILHETRQIKAKKDNMACLFCTTHCSKNL